MIISLLQLNINSDNYWNKLITYLTSNDFDILHLQELTGKDTINGIFHSKHETFTELQKILKEKYKGELSISQRYSSSPDSYLGNAIFYKNSFSLSEKKEIQLYSYGGPFPSDATTFEKVGRSLLHLKLTKGGKEISFLNTHFAWAPTPKEEPHQTKQGEILLNYLRNIQEPFVLTGDFNLDPEQPLINKLSNLATNLTKLYRITNTLNPQNHRVKELFPPGIACDYIFTSPKIKVEDFSVVEEDLSDHLGLTAEIEI